MLTGGWLGWRSTFLLCFFSALFCSVSAARGAVVAVLGGRIPVDVLLLLMAAHGVVVSFTGGRKSSAGMAKDRRPWSLGFLLLLYCPSASPLISPSSL